MLFVEVFSFTYEKICGIIVSDIMYGGDCGGDGYTKRADFHG